MEDKSTLNSQPEQEQTKKPIKYEKDDKVLYNIVLFIYLLVIVAIVITGYFVIKGVSVFKDRFYNLDISENSVIDKFQEDENMLETESNKLKEEENTLDELQNEKTTIPMVITPPPAPNSVCINRYTIMEGEFASDKCYSTDDFNDLLYYLNQYNEAIFKYNVESIKAEAACDGFSEEFKELCEDAKEGMKEYDIIIDEYKETIMSIINKGTSFSKF